MEKVKIVLAKSLIGVKPDQKATAKSLGLRKIGDAIVLANDGATAGKITVLKHLVKIETV